MKQTQKSNWILFKANAFLLFFAFFDFPFKNIMLYLDLNQQTLLQFQEDHHFLYHYPTLL